MPTFTREEQFKFLISCIRYSQNGKIDFAEVAKECQIVSKGAAAKRYERLMKSHGLHQPASTLRETFKTVDSKEDKPSASTIPVKRAAEDSTPGHSPTKKRPRQSVKTIKNESRNVAGDDEEGLDPAGVTKIQKEEKSPPVKKEVSQASYHGATSFQYPSPEEGPGSDGENSGDMLSDLWQPEELETQIGSGSPAYDGYEY